MDFPLASRVVHEVTVHIWSCEWNLRVFPDDAWGSCIAGGFFTNGAIREAAKCAYVSNFCLVKYKQSVYTVLSGDVLKKEPMLSPFIRTAPGSDGWPLAAVLEHGDKRQRTEKGKE